MPSSAIEGVPYIIEYIRKYRSNLNSILDVGVGFGKFGYLIREYFDAKSTFHFQPEEWKVHITGVDIFSGYLSQLQQLVYDEIIVGDIFDTLPTLGHYEVGLLSEVIEHFPKNKGFELLDELFNHVEDVVVSTPLGFLPKISRSVGINEYEAHVSGWNPEDFRGYTVLEQAIVPRIRKKDKVFVVYLRK